jgi:hypothetical protein
MVISENLLSATNKLNESKAAHKKDNKNHKRDYEILEGKLNAVEIDRDIKEKELNAQQRGFNWYILNDEDYIVASGQVLGGFVTTYEQPLPININSGCYKLVNGNVEVDKEKLKKYIGVILL